MRFATTRLRIYIPIVLSVLAVILLVTSFALPWWTASIDVVPLKEPIKIYGWGLQHSLTNPELVQYIVADETSLLQIVLAWGYIAINIMLILLCSRFKGNKPFIVWCVVGLVYAIYAYVAVNIVISGRLEELGLKLQGWSFMPGYLHDQPAPGLHGANINGELSIGYYLAYISAASCIIFALFRKFMLEK